MSTLPAPAGGGYLETPAEVRYAETDQMGYAHHSVAAVWFEAGRVAWMRAHGFPYRRLEEQGVRMPVVRLSVRYHRPARFEDRLAIQTRLAALGRSRVAFENRVLRREDDQGVTRTLLLEGRVELACVDRAGQVQRLPEDLRAAFARLLPAAVERA